MNSSVKLFWIWTCGSGGDVFEKISYLELWQPSCSVERNHLCNFERGHHGEHSCEVLLNLDQWFRRCHLKTFLIWSSGGPFVQRSAFCSAERNHLCFFGSGHYEEQFCKIILNLGQWFTSRCHFKIFLIWSSGSPFVQPRGTIYALLVEGIKMNSSVKLFWIWTCGSGGDVFEKISYLELWQPSCSVERNHLWNFERGHHGEHSCEVIWNLDHWF